MNQRQFDRDLDDDPDGFPHLGRINPIARLFDEDRQRSHRSNGNEDKLEWCPTCNAWTYHAPERCPRLQFKA